MYDLATLIHWCYVAGGVGVALSYWPQLRLYWRDPGTRQSIAPITWAAWSCGALVTTCYASLVVQDLPFTLVSAVNAIASIAVLLFGLSAYRKPPRPDPRQAGISIPNLISNR
jgi:hypothetical protein